MVREAEPADQPLEHARPGCLQGVLEPGPHQVEGGRVHDGIRIVGDGPAAWLAIWPAALDGFPEELERLTAAGASPAEVAVLRRHHGIEAGQRR